MARVVPLGRTVIERGVAYRQGKPVEIADENFYHHLLRTRRFRDADQSLRVIQPAKALPRLRPGNTVTVLRETGLGDVLMVLVVIRAMKAKFPHLHFRLATGSAYLPILHGLDFLADAVAIFGMRGECPNVIDLRGLPERDPYQEKLERIDIFARAFGVNVLDYSLPIAPISKEEAARARSLIGPHPTIALAVRGSTHVRTWPLPSVQRFAELAADRGWTVALLDDVRFEMPVRPAIRNLTGEIGIVDAKAVIAASEFCISPDSGLQHVAEAVGTRCLAIYSTTPPALRIAHYRYVKAIWRMSLPCVPCFDRGCPAAPCMQIAPEVVLRAVENFDSLPLSTNVDASPLPTTIAPVIRIEREAQIMESWPRCAAV